METGISFIALPNSIVFNFDNQSHTIAKGTPEYAKVCAALAESRIGDIPDIICKKSGIVKSITGSGFELRDNLVYCDGELVDSYISSKLIEFYDKGLPYTPLQNFWRRLRKNPSKNSVSQLYRFLEVAKCPITDDGMIVSMKGVMPVKGEKDTYYSKHDSSFKYTLNVPVVMARNKVVDDPERACGPGLHAGSFKYAYEWATTEGVVLELLIDPVDVVSVPSDHGSQKMRVCKMLPVAVHTGGNFDKGVIIEHKEHPQEQSNTVPGTVDTEYSINKQSYTPVIIDSATYENLVHDKDASVITNGVMRYRSSKAPAAIKKYSLHVANSLNEAYTFILPKFHSTVSFFTFKMHTSDKSAEEYCLFVPSVRANVIDEVVAYCAGAVKEDIVVINNFNKYYSDRMDVVTYNREQYELIDIGNVDINEFINECSEGVVSSVTSIKPSKVPVGLFQAVLPMRIIKLVRATLIDSSNERSVAFLCVCSDRNDTTTTLLMRRG